MNKYKKDFRGIKCPINFAKTIMALSKIQKDEILEILIDDGNAIENLPKSITLEGHIVVSQKEVHDGGWKIVIKKQS